MMWTTEDRAKTLRVLIVLVGACFIWIGLSALTAKPAKAETFIAHPRGCPARAFCGCGASVKVFGKSVRALWPSSAWFRFPRTSPRHMAVAVRRGHVFVLDRQVRGKTWMVYDYNSGRHRSRYHARSIAGYRIVDPSASRIAMVRP